MAARRSATDWAGVAAFGLVSCGTAALGTWQAQRFQWKRELIAAREAAIARPAVAWRDARVGDAGAEDDDARACEKVRLRGEFAYEQSMLVGPRSAPAGSKGASGALAASGFVVVTPFRDAESGQRLLVNRGWVPRAQADLGTRRLRPAGEPEAFEAVRSASERAGAFTPDSNAAQGSWFTLDAPAMAAARDLPEDTPLVERIDAAGDPIVSRNSDSLLVFKVNPATHVGYAATWYGLSAASLYMIRKRFFRR